MKRVNLELTNFCNYRCTICGDKRTRPVYEMQESMIGTILADINATGMNPEIRLFLSGEPFSTRSIYHALARCKHYGFKTLIHSNGSLIYDNVIDWIAKLGIGKNLTISVSLDGGDGYEYQKIRKRIPREYTRICGAVQRLIERTDINVQVQCIIPVEHKHMEPTIFDRYSQMFAGAKVSVRTPHSWAVAGSVEGAEQKEYRTCDFLFNDLVIYSDGQVGLCCACLNQEITFGDIYSDYAGDTEAAFYNPKLSKIRAQFQSKTIEPGTPCFNCERYNHG